MISYRLLIFCLLSLFVLKLSAQSGTTEGRDPKEVNYYRAVQIATAFYEKKAYSDALKVFEQALSKPEANKNDYYNAACCASLVGDLDKANTYLNKSIELGYWDLKWMSNDADFANFRQDRRWEKTIQKLNTTLNTIEAKFKPIENIHRADLIPYQENGLWGYLHRESKAILVPASFDKVGFAGDCLEIKYKNVLFSIDVQTKINLKYQDEPSNSHQQVFKLFNPPGVDSSGALKGFKVTEKGNVNMVSKDFDQGRGGPIVSPIKPLAIDGQSYLIARKQGKYGLVNQDGVAHPKIGFNYKSISLINSYTGPEKCFLVENEASELSFVLSTGEVRLQNSMDSIFSDQFAQFKFVKVRKGQREGLLDLTNLSWAIPLTENLNVLDLGFTHDDWYCSISSSSDVNQSKIIAFYFLVKNAKGQVYYTDKNQTVYLPKP